VCDRNLDQLAGAHGQADLDLEEIDDYEEAAAWTFRPSESDLETVRAMTSTSLGLPASGEAFPAGRVARRYGRNRVYWK